MLLGFYESSSQGQSLLFLPYLNYYYFFYIVIIELFQVHGPIQFIWIHLDAGKLCEPIFMYIYILQFVVDSGAWSSSDLIAYLLTTLSLPTTRSPSLFLHNLRQDLYPSFTLVTPM